MYLMSAIIGINLYLYTRTYVVIDLLNMIRRRFSVFIVYLTGNTIV